MTVIPLCVPRWEEREALEEGARYDESRGFHAPAGADLDLLWKWLPRQYDPDAPKPVLVPDMLPITTWEQNVRGRLGPEVWDRMRRHAYAAAGYRCEICGAKGKLEAHELFELENETTTQRLKKILSLCPLCHKVHHIGLAKRMGMLPDVKRHMQDINGWTPREMELALQDAYETWEQRAYLPWTVDLSWLYREGYIYV